MGEERSEELALDILKENISTVDYGEVREEDSGGCKKLSEFLHDGESLSKFVNEGKTEEQEETREQIQVQERIQVLLCFFTA